MTGLFAEYCFDCQQKLADHTIIDHFGLNEKCENMVNDYAI